MKNSLGEFLQADDVEVFFGNRLSNEAALAAEFPDLQLARLSQIHSSIIIERTTPGLHETSADGHVTRVPGLALAVRTADCLPVMIYDPHLKIVAGLHAGWRGIESEIIPQTLGRLRALGTDLGSASAWIGPHIGPQSFEVGLDVADLLLKVYRRSSGTENPVRPLADPAKAKVNLFMIARAQLHAGGISSPRIFEHVTDTMSSSEHSSFRRDRDQAGRQLSFIRLRS